MVCRIKNRHTFKSLPILNSAYFTKCRFVIRHITQTDTETETEANFTHTRYTFPEIHFWCDTFAGIYDQHSSQSLSLHACFSRGRDARLEWETCLAVRCANHSATVIRYASVKCELGCPLWLWNPGRCHQKSETGISVVPKMGMCPPKI